MNVITDFDDPGFCKGSAGTIPIFDKSFGPLSVTVDCTDCFVGYQWDFVFKLRISKFKVSGVCMSLHHAVLHSATLETHEVWLYEVRPYEVWPSLKFATTHAVSQTSGNTRLHRA